MIYVHEFRKMKAEYGILSSRLSAGFSFKTVEIFRRNSIQVSKLIALGRIVIFLACNRLPTTTTLLMSRLKFNKSHILQNNW